MSAYSSNASLGLCRLGSKRLARKPLLRKPLLRKRTGDPVVVLTYFVLAGVLITGLTSFGL